MDNWLSEHLVCPLDKQRVDLRSGELFCDSGHSYPVIDGIPVMLVRSAESTHGYIDETFRLVDEVVGMSKTHPVLDRSVNGAEIDEFVQAEVPYTSGNLYFSVQNRLTRYPFPHLRLEKSDGRRLLDVGCNWGRWSIAAGKLGYTVVGIDPSLKAVLAARRVARQVGIEATFVVGDARFLPFCDQAFDVFHSYGVFQHLSKENARTCLTEGARVLRPGGTSLVQMPNKYGIRQYQQHRRRGFTEGEAFEIRYWTPAELMETFERTFGPSEMSVDCYFGLGIQASDVDLFPLKYKAVVYASEAVRSAAKIIRPLVKIADSVYIRSKRSSES